MAAYRRVAFALFVSGATERDALVDQNIVADLRRLANHDPHAVIDEKAAPDFGAWVNFDSG